MRDRNFALSDCPLSNKWNGLWSEWTTILTPRKSNDDKFVTRPGLVGRRRDPNILNRSIARREGIYELRYTNKKKGMKLAVYVSSTNSLYESVEKICQDMSPISVQITPLLQNGFDIEIRWLICKNAASHEKDIRRKFLYPWPKVTNIAVAPALYSLPHQYPYAPPTYTQFA